MKLIIAMCALALLVSAQGFAQGGGKTTLKGYVVDQMCAKGMEKKGNFAEKAPAHTKECALEDACAASGYGIYSDGTWYTFDEKGSTLAKAAIEKSKRETGLWFSATGTLTGTQFAVASLKEGTPGVSQKSVKKQEAKDEAGSADDEAPERNPQEQTEY
jgi:hypothetical protein